MKKMFYCLIFSLSLVISTMLPTQRSEAAIGLTMGVASPLAILFGSSFTGLSIVMMYSIKDDISKRTDVLIGLISTSILGVIILDNPASPVTFGPLDQTNAKKLKVSKEDIVTYNSELDEARVAGESIAKNLIAKYGKEKNLNLNSIDNDAQKQWNNICNLDQLSPGTCRVINAIRTQKGE